MRGGVGVGQEGVPEWSGEAELTLYVWGGGGGERRVSGLPSQGGGGGGGGGGLEGAPEWAYHRVR